MKFLSLLLSIFLIKSVLAYNFKVEKIELYTEYPLICAKQIETGLNNPEEKAIANGLIGLGYLSLGDTLQSRKHYDRAREFAGKIEDVKGRNAILLAFTNRYSFALEESVMKEVVDEALFNEEKFDAFTNVKLTQSLVLLGKYNLALEKLKYAQELVDAKFEKIYGRYTWNRNTELSETIDLAVSQIYNSIDTANCISEALLEKFELADQFNLIHPLRHSFYAFERQKRDIILSLERHCSSAFVFELCREKEVGVNIMNFSGLLKITQAAIDRGELNSVAKNLPWLDSLDKSYGNNYDAVTVHLNYLKAAGQLERANDYIGQIDSYTPKFNAWLGLADLYIGSDMQSYSLVYIDSAKGMLNAIDKDNRRIDDHIKLAAVHYKLGQKNKAMGWMQEIEWLVDEQLKNERTVYGYEVERVLKQYVEMGEFDSAVKFALKQTNSGSSAVRSRALNDVYTFIKEKGEMDASMSVLELATNHLSTIEHVHEQNAFIEYTAIHYAQNGQFDRSVEIAQRFSGNSFQNTADWLKAFFLAYEKRFKKVVPENFYSDFLIVLQTDNRLRCNFSSYKILIDQYYEGANHDDFFEEKVESELKRYNLKKEFSEERLYNAMDIDFSKEELLYYLYSKSGNNEKLNRLKEIGLKRCQKKNYTLSDLENLLRIDAKYGVWWF